jgi:uncharacterized protein (DUF1800 family)
MARRKIDRFFVATSLMTPQQVESKAEVDIELQDAVGRQFVAKLVKEKPDSRFLSLSFADIYHVDDPAIKDCPKSKAHLALIDPAHRLASKAFEAKKEPAASGSNGAKQQSQPVAAATAPAASATSGDDLVGDL